MHQPIIQHTLNIFNFLTEKTPPLVSLNDKQEAKDLYARCCENHDLSLLELENHIITFGKKIWPYRKSFIEFYNIHENHLGEKFLLGAMPRELKKRYCEFKEYGGGLAELYHGGTAHFFDVEERNDLTAFVIKMKEDVRRHTVQAVLTNDRPHYEKRIAWFKEMLGNIEKHLQTLHSMANNEKNHPGLIAEIREQIKAFEHGLCLLGTPHQYSEISNAEEYFLGRKQEKNYSFV